MGEKLISRAVIAVTAFDFDFSFAKAPAFAK